MDVILAFVVGLSAGVVMDELWRPVVRPAILNGAWAWAAKQIWPVRLRLFALVPISAWEAMEYEWRIWPESWTAEGNWPPTFYEPEYEQKAERINRSPSLVRHVRRTLKGKRSAVQFAQQKFLGKKDLESWEWDFPYALPREASERWRVTYVPKWTELIALERESSAPADEGIRLAG